MTEARDRHGHRTSYTYYRCRCKACCKANTEYLRIYRNRRNDR